jgi:hypothetical protein
VLPHPKAFRTAAIAYVLHTPEKETGKVVIVKADEQFVMTVLPASFQVNLHQDRTNHPNLPPFLEHSDLLFLVGVRLSVAGYAELRELQF